MTTDNVVKQAMVRRTIVQQNLIKGYGDDGFWRQYQPGSIFITKGKVEVEEYEDEILEKAVDLVRLAVSNRVSARPFSKIFIKNGGTPELFNIACKFACDNFFSKGILDAQDISMKTANAEGDDTVTDKEKMDEDAKPNPKKTDGNGEADKLAKAGWESHLATNANVGDKVKFKTESGTKAKGKIMGAGTTHTTIKTKSGDVHRVPHANITSHSIKTYGEAPMDIRGGQSYHSANYSPMANQVKTKYTFKKKDF